MDRRKFLESLAVLGAGSILLSETNGQSIKASEPFSGECKKNGKQVFDENLVCLITDLHIRVDHYQQEYFQKTVQDILALNPLPRRIICLGDIAYLTGKVEEYKLAKKFFNPLLNAGISITMTMGNHDRRGNFSQIFPEFTAASELPGKYVYTVQTEYADFLVMDSLQEGDDLEEWITPGAIDSEQVEWLKSKLDYAKDKPVFVMAHHPLNETKLGPILLQHPNCKGYIYGHNHIWDTGWTHVNYRDRTILRHLCLPSTGHWGDIGFTLLHIEKDKAVAEFRQREFFFPKPLKEGESKPSLWSEIEREHRDAVCVFPFE